MAFWHENLSDSGTPRTHVLVIGTSLYDGLPPAGPLPPLADAGNIFQLSQVESPAISAFQIASWFRENYNNPRAPLGKIWLLLAPSPTELAASAELNAAAPCIATSTTANVETALIEWQ